MLVQFCTQSLLLKFYSQLLQYCKYVRGVRYEKQGESCLDGNNKKAKIIQHTVYEYYIKDLTIFKVPQSVSDGPLVLYDITLCSLQFSLLLLVLPHMILNNTEI